MIYKKHKRNESEDLSLESVGKVFEKHAQLNNETPRLGFKESLKARLLESERKKDMPRFDFFKGFSPAFWGMGSVAIILIVIAGLLLLPFSPLSLFGRSNIAYAKDNFTLQAETSDALGIDPATTFLLESREEMNVSEIQKLFKTNISKEPLLERISDKSIRVSFSEPLKGSELVRFSMDTDRSYAWAFQVKTPFRISGAVPGDKQNQVPLNTGIEIYFNSENVDGKEFEKHFSITPSVKGHVEQSRRIFAFVPEEPLSPQTLYTVTVSGNLTPEGSDEALGGDYTFQFETGRDEQEARTDFSVSEHYVSTHPETPPMIPVNLYTGNGEEKSAGVKLYYFNEYAKFAEALKKSTNFLWQNFVTYDELVNLEDVQLVSEFETKKVDTGQGVYLPFPKPLSEGYYIADITVDSIRSWVLLESTPLSAYIARTNDRTLVWVNSAQSKTPVIGAEVGYFDEVAKGVTDTQGVGYIPEVARPQTETEEDLEETRFIEVKKDNSHLIVPLYSYTPLTIQSPRIDPRGESGYWKYLYTDRPMYQTSDTIRFWGYVEDRDTGKRPEKVRVLIGETRYLECSRFICPGEDILSFDEVEVSVSERGTFEGTLNLKTVPPSFYNVIVEWDGKEVAKRGITVSEYVKPAYELTVEFGKEVAFTGESIPFTVKGQFFEGTPLKGLAVLVRGEGFSETLTLDDNGIAKGVYTYPYKKEEESWKRYPVGAWLTATPERPEEGRIEANASMFMFGPKVYLDVPFEEAKVEKGKGRAKIIVREVEAVNSWNPKEFGKKTLANYPVSGDLIEITYVEREIGSHYDFIEKKVVKDYSFDRVEKKIADVSVVTGADGSVLYEFVATNPKANYELRLRATDKEGRTDRTQLFLWQDRGFETWFDRSLNFYNHDIPEGVDFPGYKVGDSVHLEVYQTQKPFQVPTNGRFLYFQAMRGIQEVATSQSGKYEFPFEERDIPNLTVYGVFFNGEAYQEIGWGGNVFYQKGEKELKLELSTNKASYRPGENIEVKVTSKDAQGKPVSAEVNLNMVDESFYALMPEDVDPLSELYFWVDSGVLATQVSHRLENLSTGAEKGGGGGRGRFLFKDTAHFSRVVTNENGEAFVLFTLPDNITSWRVTAQALDTNAKMAGDTKLKVPVSLPFFLSPVLRDSYLEQDKPVILVRVAGADITPEEDVELSFEVPAISYKKEATIKAKDTGRFELPTLALGEYEIRMNAKSAKYEDRMTRKLNIVSSRLVRPIVQKVSVGENTTIPGGPSGITYVTFMDASKSAWYPALTNLAYYGSERADVVLTREAVRALLNKEFSDQWEAENIANSNYQNQGVKLFPYTQEDLELTARIALLKDTPLNETQMISFMRDRLYYGGAAEFIGEKLSPREVAWIYAGLASLGEPHLAEVQRFVQAPELGTEEKLLGAMALHFYGDDEGARKIYREAVKTTSEKDGARYIANDKIETQSELTVYLGILSGALNEPERDEIFRYLENVSHGNTLLALETFVMIRETLPHIAGNGSEVQYTLKGRQYSEKLEKGNNLTIAVQSNELNALQPKVIQGNVVAVSRYEVPLLDPNEPRDASFNVTRGYAVDGKEGKNFQEGDLIKITLQYRVPELPKQNDASQESNNTALLPQNYEVTDSIPSGLSPVTDVYSVALLGGLEPGKMCVSYPIKISGQRITFIVDNAPDTSGECPKNTLNYYARVVTPGSYFAESAFIRLSDDPNKSNHSETGSILIEE